VLAPSDRIELPPGVALVPGALVDEVRGASWPANETACFVLGQAGRRLGDVADELAARYRLPRERTRGDVLALAWQLNRGLLANVVAGEGRLARAAAWLRLALRLAPARAWPVRPARRRPLETSTLLRALASAVHATARRGLALAAAGSVVCWELVAAAGSPGVLLPALAGLAVGAGLVLHEAGHAAALRGIPAALVLDGVRTYVVHRSLPSGRRRLVALAGPCLPVAAGAALLAAGSAGGTSELAIAGCPLAAHALTLTVLAGDGRAACGL
jgi:hypothetical protein